MARLGNSDKFKKVLEALNTEFVSPSDFKRTFNVLVKAFQDLKIFVTENTAKNKVDFDSLKKTLTAKVDDLNQSVTQKVGQFEEKVGQEVSTLIQHFDKSVKALDQINPLVLSAKETSQAIDGINEQLESLSARLSSENLRNALELLSGEEELRLSIIEEIKDEIKKLKKQVTVLKGSSSVPSPMHVPTFEKFTMNGSDTSVTLAHAVGAAGNAIFNVTYQGQVLHRGNHYTVDGNKITFVGFTPGNGKIISISYMP